MIEDISTHHKLVIMMLESCSTNIVIHCTFKKQKTPQRRRFI